MGASGPKGGSTRCGRAASTRLDFTRCCLSWCAKRRTGDRFQGFGEEVCLGADEMQSGLRLGVFFWPPIFNNRGLPYNMQGVASWERNI